MPNSSLQSRNWCFTCNNPTPEQRQVILDYCQIQVVEYAVVGTEVGASGTPHLQGYIRFRVNQRFNAVRLQLPGCHIEKARGTAQQNRAYCTKDGDAVEYGTFPVGQGHRSDLDDFIQWGEQFETSHGRPPSSPEIARERPVEYIRYPRCVRLFERRGATPTIQRGPCRDGWQAELEQELEDPADDRKIIFFVDPEGNKGKTWFQQYYISKYSDGQVFSIGKRDDIAHSVSVNTRVFFFNVPRGGMEYLQYTILEQLKDRIVYSPKYDSRTKVLRFKPHVVVFCNEMPDLNKMTGDRYDMRDL